MDGCVCEFTTGTTYLQISNGTDFCDFTTQQYKLNFGDELLSYAYYYTCMCAYSVIKVTVHENNKLI